MWHWTGNVFGTTVLSGYLQAELQQVCNASVPNLMQHRSHACAFRNCVIAKTESLAVQCQRTLFSRIYCSTGKYACARQSVQYNRSTLDCLM